MKCDSSLPYSAVTIIKCDSVLIRKYAILIIIKRDEYNKARQNTPNF